jgi:alpha-ketoglutarate-dependent sulfate ester dioxygenase
MRYGETVFKSTIYETEHPVVQVHPLTGERAIILGSFVRKLLGVSSADSDRRAEAAAVSASGNGSHT